MSDPKDPRFVAAVKLIGRTGAKSFSIRYSDDEQPVVWMAVAEYHEVFEAAAGMNPLTAVMRLLDTLIDGGQCVSCKRITGVTDDWEHEMPLDKYVCWYVYDPEMQTFRRSCEAEFPKGKTGRNDPCPCGSGKKFKLCHGR